jgi:hypothetical protein
MESGLLKRSGREDSRSIPGLSVQSLVVVVVVVVVVMMMMMMMMRVKEVHLSSHGGPAQSEDRDHGHA